MVDPVVLPSTK